MLRANRRVLGYSQQILKQGDGKTFAEMGDVARIEFKLYKEIGGKVTRIFRGQDTARILVGKNQALHAVEKALQQMSEGEEAYIKCSHEYAFGEKGIPPSVPPQTNIEMEIKFKQLYRFDGDA